MTTWLIGAVIDGRRTPLCLGMDTGSLEGRIGERRRAHMSADLPISTHGLSARGDTKICLVGC